MKSQIGQGKKTNHQLHPQGAKIIQYYSNKVALYLRLITKLKHF